MYSEQEPISSIAVGNDIFVVNTRLTDSKDDYACIGRGAFFDFEEPNIIMLIEKEALSFERTAIYRIYDTINVEEESEDGFLNRVNAYAIDEKGEKLFLVINTDVYVYDLKRNEIKRLIKHEGQRILGICVDTWKQNQGLLTYSIYQNFRKEDMDLLYYYNILKDDVVEQQKWVVKPMDVSYATLSFRGDKKDIFFNHSYNKTIYRIDSTSDKYVEFYSFPDTFSIEYMISE